MAEKKTEKLDFDALLEGYDEDAALASLSESLEPRVIVVEGDAVAKFPDGEIYRLPLTFSIDDADALKEIDGDDAVEQMRKLFSRLCGDGASKALMAEPFQSVSAFANRYFDLFQKINQASLGESQASLHS
jgi:hypothetical protein